MSTHILSPRFVRWLILSSLLLVLVGYFAPWIDHRSAALVITGLDLGEYVKFLPVVHTGQVQLWREGFYLPLVAVSLLLSLNAFRHERAYPWFVRWLLIVSAFVATFNLLPPAWSPPVLRSVEFRQQMVAIAGCGCMALLSPFLVFLQQKAVAILAILLTIVSLWWPIRGLLAILPNLTELYNHPLQPGWGLYVMIIGWVGVGIISIFEIVKR